MTTLLIHGGELLTPFERVEDGAVVARDGVIEYVGRRSEFPGRADIELDVGGRLICPGFVDLQVNGGGDMLLTARPERGSIERMAAAHVRFGTTALLPTIVTAEEATMLRALEVVREAVEHPHAGARVLGSHLEGPFINPVRRGAHPERYIRAPEEELLARLLGAAGGSLRLITLAPELSGALELIKAASDASVLPSLGHSDATYDETKAAIEAGASVATHVLNAMRPLHQREPGIAAAVLDDERVVTGVIADGVHLHPGAMRLVARAKEARGVALVTDAMPPVGGEASSFTIDGRDIVVREGACYLQDGTLAGSALSMNRAVKLMHGLAGVPVRECVEMATATPARVLGQQDEIGVLKPGARADIVVCDAELDVWRVFVGGELAYERE